MYRRLILTVWQIKCRFTYYGAFMPYWALKAQARASSPPRRVVDLSNECLQVWAPNLSQSESGERSTTGAATTD